MNPCDQREEVCFKSTGCVIVAAGSGQRFDQIKAKQHTIFHGKSVLEHSIEAFQRALPESPLVVVLNKKDEQGLQVCQRYLKVLVAEGGATRAESVFNGLKQLDILNTSKALSVSKALGVSKTLKASSEPLIQQVAIHDAARPCIEPVDILNLLRSLKQSPDFHAGLLVVPVVDTIKHKRIDSPSLEIKQTVDRSNLYHAQTPQVFSFKRLLGYMNVSSDRLAEYSDECSLFEARGERILMVQGQRSNIKLTYPEDALFIDAYLVQNLDRRSR